MNSQQDPTIRLPSDVDKWAERLKSLGLAVRDRIVQDRQQGASLQWQRVMAREGGDEIFGVDRLVEPIITEHVEKWPEATRPLTLVVEGLGETGVRRIGPDGTSVRYRLIIDPIDGTRCLMFDKRAAWFVAAVALESETEARLDEVFAAALVELPTSKQGWADSFTAVRGQGCKGSRMHLERRESQSLQFQPDSAASILHRFASVVSLFPAAKVHAAQLAQRIAAAVSHPSQASVFEDQYPSTAGQMVELMTGRDVFCCDLRPLFFRLPGSGEGLPCHPYDVAGALVAQEAGVIITDGFSRPMRNRLNVHEPVHWCGYANAALQAQLEPLVQQWLREQGCERPDH